MKRLKAFAGMIVLVALAGCSTAMLPVQASILESTETFSGEMTEGTRGSGQMRLMSSRGVVCQGDFVYRLGGEGSGVFNCTDLRWGHFEFLSSGTHGTGVGDLAGQRITFTFGK